MPRTGFGRVDPVDLAFVPTQRGSREELHEAALCLEIAKGEPRTPPGSRLQHVLDEALLVHLASEVGVGVDLDRAPDVHEALFEVSRVDEERAAIGGGLV